MTIKRYTGIFCQNIEIAFQNLSKPQENCSQINLYNSHSEENNGRKIFYIAICIVGKNVVCDMGLIGTTRA